MKKWQFYTTNEIKPSGWLKRQLQLQAEGLSGNLDKVWPDVRDSAWIGGGREGWERVPYWLDGFIPLAYLLEDGDMITRAKKYIDAIVSSQQEDGWICPCGKEERSAYDTWAVLLITKVLTVYYDCSRDERIPRVIYRVLKNYYELLKSGTVRLFDWGKSRWYEGFIAIDFTYGRFPEYWLLELARILKEQGMDWDTAVPLWERPLNLWRQETHVVNMAMMLKAEAVSCDLLGRKYTDHAQYWLDVLDRYNGTAVGTFTGDECLSGLSPIQGTELCSVVEQMYSYEHLYAYTGDSKWAERLEILAFNALPAAISEDMWAHQYVQMSNQIACQIFPGKSLFRTNGPDAHIFGLEPHFGCCTSNFGQGWPKLTLSAFLHQGSNVISSIPVPSELKTDDLHIVLETNYPFAHCLTYTIESAAAFTFCIRIPSFAKNLTVDGAPAPLGDLTFEIRAGERRKIHVSFDADPHFEERPRGLQTVKWGSLVFSVPIRYEMRMHEYEKDGVERKFPYCDYEYVPTSDWNYGYCNKELILKTGTVGDVPFSGIEPPVVIKTEMQKVDWGLEDGYEAVCAKRPQSEAPVSVPEEIALHPYGCAKLRITEAPAIGE